VNSHFEKKEDIYLCEAFVYLMQYLDLRHLTQSRHLSSEKNANINLLLVVNDFSLEKRNKRPVVGADKYQISLLDVGVGASQGRYVKTVAC